MRTMTRHPARGLAASLLLIFAAAAFGQDEAGAGGGDGMLTGWHIVRPGENLIRITTKYLGSPARWRENWKLNPEIKNPHVIAPGTRLRILLDFELAPPVARLKEVSGQVEERPVPIPWNDAQAEDLLVEKDGLRTYKDSSTELEFRDGSNLVLSEESLVFLRTSERSVTGPKKRSVEIVEGQAEVQALEPGAPRTDIEILVGTAKATATQSEDGLAQARARKAADGAAQVMVYEGASEVEAGGESVEVPKGMGTAVPENARPSPPEKLLPPPAPLEPAAASEWPFGNPWFSWQPVPEARAHTVEICADPGCGQLVRRAAEVRDARWRPEPLPEGDLYWRVTAVAPSGLDGYPSEAVPFKILFSGTDTLPPTGELSVSGESVTRDGVTYYEAGASIEASMTDGESGIESWTVEVDGRQLDESELAGPWATGEHTARVVGVDRAGNRGASDSIRFQVDADGPAVELRTGGSELVAEKLGVGSIPEQWCKRRKRWVKRYTRPTSGEWPVWTLIAAGSTETPMTDDYDPEEILRPGQRTDLRVDVAGDDPGVLLLAAGRLDVGPSAVTVEDGGDVSFCRPAGPGGPGYAKNAILWVGATDAGSGKVVSLSIDTESRDAADPGAAAEIHLVVETEDVLGNRRRVELPFRPLKTTD